MGLWCVKTKVKAVLFGISDGNYRLVSAVLCYAVGINGSDINFRHSHLAESADNGASFDIKLVLVAYFRIGTAAAFTAYLAFRLASVGGGFRDLLCLCNEIRTAVLYDPAANLIPVNGTRNEYGFAVYVANTVAEIIKIFNFKRENIILFHNTTFTLLHFIKLKGKIQLFAHNLKKSS